MKRHLNRQLWVLDTRIQVRLDQRQRVCSCHDDSICWTHFLLANDDWGDAFESNDNEVPGGWGTTPSPPVVQPKPAKAVPKPAVLATRSTSSHSPVPSRGVSPVPPTPQASTTGMTKEEKAAEMARRKEERKQVRNSCLRRTASPSHFGHDSALLH